MGGLSEREMRERRTRIWRHWVRAGAAAVFLVAIVLFIVSIWAGDGRIAGTGGVLVGLTATLLLIAAPWEEV